MTDDTTDTDESEEETVWVGLTAIPATNSAHIEAFRTQAQADGGTPEGHPDPCGCYKCSDPQTGHHERRQLERIEDRKRERRHPRWDPPQSRRDF